MALEQKRGISITSTVLQFPYRHDVLNLLDTPGHRDFSEDTYRVLAAADAAIMVLDTAKGIEPQTLKLFEVCRDRGLPLITFLNKYDRPGRPPLELLDEIDRLGDTPAKMMEVDIERARGWQAVAAGEPDRGRQLLRRATELGLERGKCSLAVWAA